MILGFNPKLSTANDEHHEQVPDRTIDKQNMATATDLGASQVCILQGPLGCLGNPQRVECARPARRPIKRDDSQLREVNLDSLLLEIPSVVAMQPYRQQRNETNPGDYARDGHRKQAPPGCRLLLLQGAGLAGRDIDDGVHALAKLVHIEVAVRARLLWAAFIQVSTAPIHERQHLCLCELLWQDKPEHSAL